MRVRTDLFALRKTPFDVIDRSPTLDELRVLFDYRRHYRRQQATLTLGPEEALLLFEM